LAPVSGGRPVLPGPGGKTARAGGRWARGEAAGGRGEAGAGIPRLSASGENRAGVGSAEGRGGGHAGNSAWVGYLVDGGAGTPAHTEQVLATAGRQGHRAGRGGSVPFHRGPGQVERSSGPRTRRHGPGPAGCSAAGGSSCGSCRTGRRRFRAAPAHYHRARRPGGAAIAGVRQRGGHDGAVRRRAPGPLEASSTNLAHHTCRIPSVGPSGEGKGRQLSHRATHSIQPNVRVSQSSSRRLEPGRAARS